VQIYCLPVLSDNYVFLLHDAEHDVATVVYPAEEGAVIECLQTLRAELIAIFSTHHHVERVGGNLGLLQRLTISLVC
jgi:hydroxyacylglutathione hydrolase